MIRHAYASSSASEVIPQANCLESVDPGLSLWDTHDSRVIKTRRLIFETRVGPGRLLVRALNHHGESNAAGRWLLTEFTIGTALGASSGRWSCARRR